MEYCESERNWREGKGREAETHTERESEREQEIEKQPGREGAGGLVALHNTHLEQLCTQDLVRSPPGGNFLSRCCCRDCAASKRESTESLELLHRTNNSKRRAVQRNRSEDTYSLTGRKKPWLCSASSGCGETGELFLVL